MLFFLATSLYAADDKQGRFIEDQPDINDDYQMNNNDILVGYSDNDIRMISISENNLIGGGYIFFLR